MADVKKVATRDAYGKAPNDAEHEQAIGELKAILAELEGK